MKRLLLLLLCALLFTAACSKDDLSSTESSEEKGIFSDHKLSEKLDCDWLFLPTEAEVIRTAEENGELKAIFKGCEYPEINAYAKELFDVLTERGCKVYDAMEPLHPKRLTEFKAAELDIKFAGRAYSYYYTVDDAIYMLTLHYYGSAGGTYGNGQSTLVISDVTKKVDSLLKE